MQHIFKPVILRKYDVRGIYGKDLFDEDGYFFGLTFARYILQNKIDGLSASAVVGNDGRLSSPALKKELIKGLIDGGIDVVDIGTAHTPKIEFTAKYLKMVASIAVTASHNPKEYNGFKFDFAGKAFFDKDILKLAEMAMDCKKAQVQGKYQQINIDDEYINHLLRDFDISKDLKICFDCGNGATGEILSKIIEKLGINAKILFAEVDGNFPNHHPDPSVEKNMQMLANEVIKGKYVAGIGFDGDGDRIGVVDEKGRLLYGDELLLLLAQNELQKQPSSYVVGEVKASKILYDGIKKAGGKPIMSAIGNPYIKEKVDEYQAVVGGETSGHFSFYGKEVFDGDAIYCCMKVLEILSNNREPLSNFKNKLPVVYATHNANFPIAEEDKFEIIKRIADNLKKAGREFIDIDGVRISNDKGWWMIRASNTTAVLTAKCEADTQEEFERQKEDLADNLLKVGYRGNIAFDD